MEKENMPAYQRMTDAPPNYNQSHHTGPASSASVGDGIIQSSDQATIPMQSQQQPQPQSQPMMIQCQQIPPLGPYPCLVTCPACHQQKMSNVRLISGSKTHLFASLLCLVGLCFCAWIPYFTDSCKNVNHFCSNCDAYLGAYTN